MADDSVLKLRLLAKEASLKSLTKRYLAFAGAIEKGTVEESEQLYEALLKEVAAYEFALSKARLFIDTNTQQVADYADMHRGIEAEMCAHAPSARGPPRLAPAQHARPLTRARRRSSARRKSTREDIERLAAQLEEERTIRQQKEQYAALSKRINQLPPRDQTQREIVALEAEVATLKEEGEAVASRLELRSKRFAGFMHALHDLQLQIDEEQKD